MTAAVDVRGISDVSTGSSGLHARAASDFFLNKRQEGSGNPEADKAFEEFKATLTQPQKDKEAQIKKTKDELNAMFTPEQNKALDQMDQLDSQGKTDEANKLDEDFGKKMTEEQKKKEGELNTLQDEADKLLSPEQKAKLEQVDKLESNPKPSGAPQPSAAPTPAA